MNIPFTKAHGAGNDFLLSWADDVPTANHPAIARAICDRHTGIGADGWMLVRDASIRLFNADGSEAEISGNGTRCAAALLFDAGRAAGDLTITTSASFLNGPTYPSCVPSTSTPSKRASTNAARASL